MKSTLFALAFGTSAGALIPLLPAAVQAQQKIEVVANLTGAMPTGVAVAPNADFLEVFYDPSHPEHADMKRWAGRAFHPEKFDLTKTDRAVRAAVRSAKCRAALLRYD